MSAMITIDEKIEIVERFIRDRKQAPKGTPQDRDRMILCAIASDLSARRATAPSAAEDQIERRLRGVRNAQDRGDDLTGAKISLANEVMGRWPVIRQSLERFGAEIE